MKKLIIFILCISMSLMLIGCFDFKKITDKSEPQESIDNNTNEDTDESEFVYNPEYISDHLGNEYSIAYDITLYENSKESKKVTVLIKKNESGYYFKMGDEDEIMYQKDGDAYAICLKDDETGSFSKVEGMTMTEDTIKATAGMFLSYMSYYQSYIDDLVSDGSATVCGRSCDKYIMNYSGLGVSQNIEYYIDKETGVCMKYSYDLGVSEDFSGFDFECVEFSLEDVELPECIN